MPRKRFRFAVLFRSSLTTSLFLVLLAGAAAQQSPLSTLSKIRGGLTELRPIKTISIRGTVTSSTAFAQTTGTISLKAHSQGSSEVDMRWPDGHNVMEVRNGEGINPWRTWTAEDGGAKKSSLKDTRLPHPAWFFPSFILLSGLGSPDYWFSDLGAQTWEGKNVEHIAIWQRLPVAIAATANAARQQQIQTDVYLDSATLLPVSMIFNVRIDPTLPNEIFVPTTTTSGNATVQVDYSDYRTVEGAQVPFQIRISNGSVPMLNIQVSSVTVNGDQAPEDSN
jgi:hypothetical protein